MRALHPLSAVFSALVLPAPASAYQIDCAILLCLAGGWPASAPCAAAQAEFVRRVTPWPVEPPLQIWRCPMGASRPVEGHTGPRVIEASADHASSALPMILPREQDRLPSRLVPTQQQADIDISDPAFDFVRSIRVWHIQYSRYWGDTSETCWVSDNTRLGTYGTQGDFDWSASRASDVPAISGFGISGPCKGTNYSYRSVFVDWRDHAGNYGFEEVRY